MTNRQTVIAARAPLARQPAFPARITCKQETDNR